jgi:hypothetical protein
MLTIEKKSLNVGRYVNTEHVNTVIGNYKRERWAHKSRHIGKEDSMSAWYSIEELEDFIAKIKEHGGDGMRFYFAAYSSDFAGREGYADRQTIVMVGTKHNESLSGRADKDIYISTEEGHTILAYNMGTICPPTCSKGNGSGGGTPDADDWGGIGTTLVDCGDQGMVVV